MFELLGSVFKFVAEAVIAYAASDQGKQELVDIANEVEANGFDIPFYEPSDEEGAGEQGVRGNVGDFGSTEPASDPNVSTRRIIHAKVG